MPATAIPRFSIGAKPLARAMRKNSQAPSAETTASSAASSAPPARTMPIATGAAATPNRTRRGSSELTLRSHFHDLGLFGLDQLVDLVDVVVVHFLNVLLGVLHVVFGNALQLLERLARVRARVTNGDFPFLGVPVPDFHQLFAPLLVHHRERHANESALRRRLEPELRFANRLFDNLDLTLVERPHGPDPRPRGGERPP